MSCLTRITTKVTSSIIPATQDIKLQPSHNLVDLSALCAIFLYIAQDKSVLTARVWALALLSRFATEMLVCTQARNLKAEYYKLSLILIYLYKFRSSQSLRGLYTEKNRPLAADGFLRI